MCVPAEKLRICHSLIQRDAAMRNELQERLERLIAKATEQGLDVKLGLANAEDYSEEGEQANAVNGDEHVGRMPVWL